MGNDLGKKYDIPEHHNATAGLNQLWRLYPVRAKEGTGAGEDLTLWLIEKDDLTSRTTNPITDKTTLERIFQATRTDVNTAKDMSHSGVVRVVDVLQDNKKVFAFITERVLCSLADFLTQFTNIPGGYSWHQPYFEANGTMMESEIARGFLNVVEGLQYMHNVKKKLHLNVSPESIVMTPSGQWKLCGFGFSLGFVAGNEMQIPCPYFLNPAPTAVRLEPDLRYTAPELTEGGTQLQDIRYATRACDVFSLALVAYEMYHYNLRLAPAGKRNYPPVQMIANSVASHYEAMHTGLRSLDLSALPPGFSQVLSCMLQENPTARIALLDVVNSAYFHSGILSTLKSVDSLPERDMGTQASVLASLPGQLGQLPPRILAMIVLPGLCDLTTANPSMWNYTMPVHVFVASKLNARDYQRVVENAFILGLQETSVDALLAFIRNMDHLRDNFDVDFFKTHVAKMICNALDNKLSALQIQSLQALADEKVFTVIDMPEFVANIIPRVCKAACKSSEVAVKVLLFHVYISPLSLFADCVDS